MRDSLILARIRRPAAAGASARQRRGLAASGGYCGWRRGAPPIFLSDARHRHEKSLRRYFSRPLFLKG